MSAVLKTCPRCGETKPLDAFGKSKGRKHGVKGFCRPCHNATNKESRQRNPESSRQSSERWRAANPDQAKARQRKWREENRERFTGMVMDWRERNPDKVRAASAARKTDPLYRIRRTLSSRIRLLMLGKGGRKTEELVGYSAAELKAHIERQFVPGMSWENYGEWHIDHILPVASFQYASLDDPEIRRAWSLPNLRPLWAKQNLQKHDTVLHLI